MKKMIIRIMNIGLFALPNTNVHTTTAYADSNTGSTTAYTSSQGLTPEMKTFYAKDLIKLAKANLVYAQFGQKRPIPKNNGKTIEFRKYDNLPKALTPLTEGITPDGRKMNVTTIEATVSQYGDYISISDILQLAAIDNQILEATELIANQAALTIDTIVKAVLAANGNVQYGEGSKNSRASLAATDVLTVDAIRMAVRSLEAADAPKIGGSYIGIVGPDTKFDLLDDPKWEYPKDYCDPEDKYNNEIGRIAGVRFVESSQAICYGKVAASNTKSVYGTMIIGKDAYGVSEITGGGLQHIIKQLGSAGTADALDQRATVGWKATVGATILVPQYMVRIETCASTDGANNLTA